MLPLSIDDLRIKPQVRCCTAKVQADITVRKPNKQEFFRAHSEETHLIEVNLLCDKAEGEFYLTAPSLAAEISDAIPYRLVLCSNREGKIFLHPLKLAGIDGRLDHWSESSHNIVELAKEKWVRVESSRSAGCYEAYVARSDLGEPQWGTKTFDEIIRVAFSKRYIDSLDHPVLKKLRGEI